MSESSAQIPNQDALPWLVLSAIPGLGPATFALLLQHFQTPERVLSASFQDLCTLPNIGQATAGAIINQQNWQTAHDQVQCATQAEVHILTMNHVFYPPLLKQIYAPPPILFVKGHLSLCQNPAVAIVGSRSYTAYGRDTARKLSADLAQAGITIVSGLASGIDTHAHRGALDIQGLTTAVLGSALDCPYPPENGGLLQEILQNGLVVSEFPMGTGPEAHHFPRRNRIISGLSLATVVVEAGTRSGALLTAQHALEQNREVFAVPGPINSGKSTGTNQLIRNGAILVRNADDILCEIAPQIPSTTSPTPIPELDAQERRIYDILSSEGCHIDAIARNIQAPSAQTLEILLQLELKNIVEQMPGMRYRRK